MKNKQIIFNVELASPTKVKQGIPPTVFTNDTNTVEFIFNVTDLEVPETATAEVNIFMRDGSFFQKDALVEGSEIRYTLSDTEGKHAGLAQIQMTLSYENKRYSTNIFQFKIDSGLNDKVAVEVLIQDWDSITTEARQYLEQLADDRTEFSEIIADAQAQVDANVVEGAVENKFNALEAEYAQDITSLKQSDISLTAQLQQTELMPYNPNNIWEEFEQRFVNVKWFGAQGNANFYDEVNKKYYQDSAMTIPATDDRQAFRDAVMLLNQRGGGVIYAPKGNYLFKSGVEWESKVSLIGEGVGLTKFVTEGEIFDLFYKVNRKANGQDGADPTAWLTDIRFEDFEVDLIGLSSTLSNVSGKALFILYMQRTVFRNLLLKNTIGTALGCDFLTETLIDNVTVINAGRNWGEPGPSGPPIAMGQSGIGIGTAALVSETVTVQNCHVYDCGNYGIFVETQYGTAATKHAKIINNHVEGNRIGIANKGSGASIISGNTAYKNIEYGIEEQEYIGNGDTISNNHIEENGLDGLYINRSHDGVLHIFGNTIYNNGERGIYVDGDDYYNQQNKAFVINNNRIFGNGNEGIYFALTVASRKHLNVDIKNNTIYNNCHVAGNTAILLKSIDKVNVIGNTIYDDTNTPKQTVPLFIDGDVEDYYIDSNDFGTELLYKFYSTNGRIGENKGLSNMTSGKATFADGDANVTISHNLYRPFEAPATPQPPIISVSSSRNVPVWVSANNTNSNLAQLTRSDTTGTLDVYWMARRV